jgi:GLPGLI family protein
MIKRFYSYLTLIISVSILSAGCSSPTDEKFLEEGVIEYDATAVDQTNPMANLAPTKMVVKFKDNKLVAQMTAGMGVVSFSVISDPEAKQLTEMVKFLTSKSAHVSDSNEVRKENDSLPRVKIEPTNDVKVIAGYNCKKANVIYLDQKDRPGFTIYYTDELNIKGSNWSNHFSPINGMLMEYQVDRYGIEMRFTATKIKKEEVDNSAFDLPKEYKIISAAEMREIFKGFQ